MIRYKPVRNAQLYIRAHTPDRQTDRQRPNTDRETDPNQTELNAIEMNCSKPKPNLTLCVE
jgi:hypothetical protein